MGSHGRGSARTADAAVLAELIQQPQHACPQGHVQHRNGLIGDDQLRLAGQRVRDDDALALAAGQLMRQLFLELPGRGQPDRAQQLADPLGDLAAAQAQVVGDRTG
jgi:hypothetical protein